MTRRKPEPGDTVAAIVAISAIITVTIILFYVFMRAAG